LADVDYWLIIDDGRLSIYIPVMLIILPTVSQYQLSADNLFNFENSVTTVLNTDHNGMRGPSYPCFELLRNGPSLSICL